MDARRLLGAMLLAAGGVLVAIGLVGLLTAPVGSGAPTASPPGQSPVAGASPTAALPSPTAAPSAPPTASPTTAPTQDARGLVEAFLADLAASIQDGTQETMADRLGQATIDRYGREACEQDLATKVAVPEQAFEVISVSGPAPWDYETDGLSTTVPDALTVEASVTGLDPAGGISTAVRELHLQLVDGAVFWFTDCGTPIG